MGHYTLPGNPPVDLTLRRSARARRLSLRVSRLDGRVTLTLPPRVSDREALEFARQKQDWLRKHLSAQSPKRRIALGGTLPFQGVELPIVAGNGRAARVEGGNLVVPGGSERVGARAQAFLKVQARLRLMRASEHYAGLLGRKIGKISLRDTRSRWGSCSSEGNLMYSWRLIMGPPEVLDYVAAHEAAHLVHMDHSDRFWSVVAEIFPNHKACRKWLRDNGDQLHAIRFED